MCAGHRRISAQPGLKGPRGLSKHGASSSMLRLIAGSSSLGLRRVRGVLHSPRRGFRELVLSKGCSDALAEMGITEATHQQRRSVKHALDGRDVALFGRTGSGKTLAFVVPAVEKLVADVETATIELPEPCRPRVLVILPTCELCLQVAKVFKSFAHHMKFRVMAAQKKKNFRDRSRRMKECGADVFVATPAQIERHRDDGSLFLSRVEMVVIDEADTTLVDFGAAKDVVRAVLAKRSAQDAIPCQFFLSSATAFPEFSKQIQKQFDNIVQIVDKDLHRPVDSLREVFLLCQNLMKLETLQTCIQTEEQTLVFCNNIASCRAIEHGLNERGFHVGTYHGEMPRLVRESVFNEFLSGDLKLLVCTDIAARGLDISNIEHVINFDFPRSTAEYIHRAGRTARFGAAGKLTNLYVKKEKRTVQDITSNFPREIKHSLGRGQRRHRGGMQAKVGKAFANIKNRRPRESIPYFKRKGGGKL